VAHTPVFRLSGFPTLLNVFSTRLARVADRVEAVGKALEGTDAKASSSQLVHLHRRSLPLDVAVVLGAIGGAVTCAAVLALFVGALREATIASVLFALFGLAVVCALDGIVARCETMGSIARRMKASDHFQVACYLMYVGLSDNTQTVPTRLTTETQAFDARVGGPRFENRLFLGYMGQAMTSACRWKRISTLMRWLDCPKLTSSNG
jgi:hypothetical protein